MTGVKQESAGQRAGPARRYPRCPVGGIQFSRMPLLRFLRNELPMILATPSDVLSPRMVRGIEDLAGDWRRLDDRIEGLSGEKASDSAEASASTPLHRALA